MENSAGTDFLFDRYFSFEKNFPLRSIFLLVSFLCFFRPAFAEVPSEAQRLIAQNRHIDAIQVLELWIDEHARDSKALFALGAEYAHANMLHKAIETYQHISVLRPSLAEPHANLATIYSALGNDQMAIDEMNVYLEKYPSSTVAHEKLAELHLKAALKHYKYALDYDKSIELQSRFQSLQDLLKSGLKSFYEKRDK